MMAVGALLAAWTTWRYHSARIEVDESGLRQTTPFGRKSLRWSEVERHGARGVASDAVYEIFGNGVRIAAGGFITDRDDLMREVERRTGLSPE